MAVLLVAMSVMAVMMTAVMPVWKHQAQREKEEELVFRGLQYVHAIGLYQRKFANAYPPNIDVLVEQRFLRKKFKDPITNDDFVPILAGQALPGTSSTANSAQGGRGPANSTSPSTGPGSTQPVTPATGAGGRGTSPIGTPGAGASTGVSGVTSKSKESSIRIYNGRTHYNEWASVYTAATQAPGAGGAPGTSAPGQRGQQNNGQPGAPGVGGVGGRGRGQGGRGGPGTPPNGPGGRGFGPGTGFPTSPPLFPPTGRF
jgi:type II secretory pathway pseudopilin PulG